MKRRRNPDDYVTATLSKFGSPFEKGSKGNRTFDFPQGLGKTGEKLFGLPGDITTDAKNSMNSSAIKSMIDKRFSFNKQ